MTDNTQELDEILTVFAYGEYSPHWTDERKTYTKLEAKQSILDWHNKQVEELLDRLTVADNISDRACSEAIQAERANLKEVK